MGGNGESDGNDPPDPVEEFVWKRAMKRKAGRSIYDQVMDDLASKAAEDEKVKDAPYIDRNRK